MAFLNLALHAQRDLIPCTWTVLDARTSAAAKQSTCKDTQGPSAPGVQALKYRVLTQSVTTLPCLGTQSTHVIGRDFVAMCGLPFWFGPKTVGPKPP